jgi:hypothetical protein
LTARETPLCCESPINQSQPANDAQLLDVSRFNAFKAFKNVMPSKKRNRFLGEPANRIR